MTIEQLRELIERLQGDQAAQVTNEELAQARAFIREQKQHLRGQPVSDDVLAAAEELVAAHTAVTETITARETTAAELEGKRNSLLDQLGDDDQADAPAADAPADADASVDPAAAPAADGDAGTQGAPGADGAPGDAAPVDPQAADPMPVAASGKAPRRAPIGTFRNATTPPATPPQNAAALARGVVTAAGGSPQFNQGQPLNSTADLALAMTDQLRAMSAGRGAIGDKVYVAHVQHQYPEDRVLRAKDWVGNFSKIENVVGEQAMVAAGGLCAPLQTLYDVQVIGSVARPIKGALAAFQVDRGGIQFRPNSSAATALTTGSGRGVGTWTTDQDASSSGDTKGCYIVDCPAIQEAEIQAIYLCLEFSNITARFDPETTAANVRQGMIAHARLAENELLRQLQATSKIVSAPRVIGAVRDILVNIDKMSAYYRNRHRIDTDVSLTSIMPAWVLYLMRADLARQMASADWADALGVTDAMIENWFRQRGVNPVWHLDGGIGGTNEVQTLTITGSPTGGSYTLTFSGQTTSAIPYNATTADVKAALEGLSNVNFGDVTVAGGPHPGTAITVAFGGQYEHTDVAQMTATGSFTGGSSPAIAVTTTTTSSLSGTVSGITIPSQVYANVAAGSAIPGFPDQIDALFFVSGTKLFLDGGSLDLGLVRDSTLNARNRYRQFSETFEGVADRGIENLRVIMSVQPTGQTSGTKDLDAIAD